MKDDYWIHYNEQGEQILSLNQSQKGKDESFSDLVIPSENV